MTSHITSAEVAKIALEMRSRFLVPFPLEPCMSGVSNWSQRLPASLKQPIDAFCDAIIATHATTTLPYQLASSGASAIHFQRFHMAERIRSLKVGPWESRTEDEKKVSEKNAYEVACNKFHSYQSSSAGLNALVEDLSSALLTALNNSATAEAADELLYQAVVSLWSAFEVFARDELTIVLNGWPSLTERLLSDPSTKKLFELPKISIDDLSSVDFDLSKSMGNVLFGSRDFSDIRTIKAAFGSICDDPELARELNSDLLWHLNQDRHLIVHRRGIVDRRYLSVTKRNVELGDRINVTPDEVETYFKATTNAATAILQGLSKVLSDSEINPDVEVPSDLHGNR